MLRQILLTFVVCSIWLGVSWGSDDMSVAKSLQDETEQLITTQSTITLLEDKIKTRQARVTKLKNRLSHLSARAIHLQRKQKDPRSPSKTYREHQITIKVLSDTLNTQMKELQQDENDLSQLKQLLHAENKVKQNREEKIVALTQKKEQQKKADTVEVDWPISDPKATDQKTTKVALKKKPIPSEERIEVKKKPQQKFFLQPAVGHTIITYKNPDYTPVDRDYGLIIETQGENPVVSPTGGKITYVGDFLSYGPVIMIQTDNNRDIFLSGVGHPLVKEGETVNQGAPIAITHSHWDHGLYVEVRDENQIALDPKVWLDEEIINQ